MKICAIAAMVFGMASMNFAATPALTKACVHAGMAGASAGVAIDSERFLVADDEENNLRLYSASQEGGPLAEFSLAEFLMVPGKEQEADLEGAARLGGLVFWIGSHGTDKKGQFQLARNCFFATKVSVKGGQVEVVPAGQPYRRLVDDLLADSRYSRFDLEEARRIKPKTSEGLNIEGLAEGPEKTLLIGFRAPLYRSKALIAHLLNPAEVIEGAAARFGDPLMVDLDERGVRDIGRVGASWIIVGGGVGKSGKPALFRVKSWEEKPELLNVKGLGAYNPEALLPHPEFSDRIQVLSDDDKKSGQSSFRSFWVEFR